MERRRLTETKRAALAVLASGRVLRRRGAYGESHSSDPSFFGSRTLDQMQADGLIVPGDSWGTFVAAPSKGEK